MGLFHLSGRIAVRPCFETAILARGDWKSAGCHAGFSHLRGGDRVDDIDRRSGFYYAGELHELADLLFYEAVRPALAPNVGL